MNKAYKFRIYPNIEQQILLAKTFGCVRFIYNKMLGEKIAHYEATKESLRTTPAQYKTEYEWLKEVDSLALANAQLHLESAYKNFFRDKRVGYPKFKSKHKGHNSYTTNLVNGNITLGDGSIKLPKVGKIRIKQHRQIPEGYVLKSVTVSKTPSRKYHVSILYEYEIEIEVKSVQAENIVGLDFSMQELYVSSDGERPAHSGFYRKAQAKLSKEQKKLSRRKEGGKNREKQRLKVARLHERTANQRKDFLHKQSKQITNAYEAVAIEDLNMKAMSQSLNFGKSVADNGWGMFTRFLDYKLREKGKKLVRVDKWFPSSKRCHVCGFINDELKLGDRDWVCASCGTHHDRDLNAAKNIQREGMRLLLAESSLGTVGRTEIAR